MCTGAEIPAIIGTVASLAGTGVSIVGAKASQEAMDQQVRNQLAAQAGFQQQATPLFVKSLEQSSPQVAQSEIQKGAQDIAERYRQAQQTPLSTAAPSVELTSQNKQLVQGQIGQQNQAQAGLQGYQELAFQQWLKDQAASQGLETVNTLSQGSASVAPILAQLAGRSGAGLQGAGSLLTSLGGLSSLYGATRPTFTQQLQQNAGPGTQLGG